VVPDFTNNRRSSARSLCILISDAQNRAVGGGTQRPMPVIRIGGGCATRRKRLHGAGDGVQGNVDQNACPRSQADIFPQRRHERGSAYPNLVSARRKILGRIVTVSVGEYSGSESGGRGENLHHRTHLRGPRTVFHYSGNNSHALSKQRSPYGKEHR